MFSVPLRDLRDVRSADDHPEVRRRGDGEPGEKDEPVGGRGLHRVDPQTDGVPVALGPYGIRGTHGVRGVCRKNVPGIVLELQPG